MEKEILFLLKKYRKEIIPNEWITELKMYPWAKKNVVNIEIVYKKKKPIIPWHPKSKTFKSLQKTLEKTNPYPIIENKNKNK